MAKIVLTDMGVQKLRPGTYFDSKTPAFGIRVGKNRRTWIATKGTDRKVITLGHYPSLGLSEARKKAYAAFLAPEAVKAIITFPEALQAFLGQDRWRPQTKRVLTSNLNHFPWKGQLAKITHEQVLAALENIEGSSARWHARKDITTFFNWCIPRYITTSPAAGIRMPTQPTRERVLTDDELKAVWKAAQAAGPFGILLRILLLTGQRRGEIGGLHSSMVSKDRLYFPPSLTKNGREHWVPLTAYATTLLPKRGNGFIFPNENGDAFTAYAFHFNKIREAVGFDDFTIHDARRTVATNMAALGVRLEVTEALLNHVSGTKGGLVGIYQRYDYWAERVAAITAWQTRLLTIVGA